MQKKTSSKFGKHLTVVLKEMCKRVKAKYDSIDFKSTEWYRKHTWSCAQQESFEGWLTDYLYRNRDARMELCERSYASKALCRKVAKEFNFMYGWILNDYPQEVSQGQKRKHVQGQPA